MNQSYLLLGSNIGDRAAWLRKALGEINKRFGMIRLYSPVYETAAWGNEAQASFYNQAVRLETPLSAQELLSGLQEIEKEVASRKRGQKWAPRTLDIDILFFNVDVFDEPGLTIPHPRLQERRFALAPLNDIAPEFYHPVLNKTVSELLAECPDPLEVRQADLFPSKP